jgi:Arc/MetJ family transcription regulator
MLYIMRRTQLYLEDDLWAALHAKALLEKATVSELVRVAVRERYMGNLEERRAAMLASLDSGRIVPAWRMRNPSSAICATMTGWNGWQPSERPHRLRHCH